MAALKLLLLFSFLVFSFHFCSRFVLNGSGLARSKQFGQEFFLGLRPPEPQQTLILLASGRTDVLTWVFPELPAELDWVLWGRLRSNKPQLCSMNQSQMEQAQATSRQIYVPFVLANL
jgi:hypothetical protein